MLRKILFASDLTEASAPALVLALELGRRLGARVAALHVTEPVYESRRWYGALREDEIEFYRVVSEREQAAALRVLAEQVNPPPGEAPAVEVLVRSGSPAEVICEVAREADVDLIIMGTHGRSGLQHALLGSIAERVIRTASCAVLTVRAPGTLTP